jgi:hypothetical protein
VALRRSSLSIARGQWKDRNSGGVTCFPAAPGARVEEIGHSNGVTESLGIAVLSRGHSYGMAPPISGSLLSLPSTRSRAARHAMGARTRKQEEGRRPFALFAGMNDPQLLVGFLREISKLPAYSGSHKVPPRFFFHLLGYEAPTRWGW